MQLTTSFLGTRFSKLQITAEPRANPNGQRMVTTMAKKKGVRCIVTLECTEARTEGSTPSRYVTQKVRSHAMCWSWRYHACQRRAQPLAAA